MSKRREQPPPAPAPTDIDARVMPHSIEAEKAVLGAVLINNAAFERALGTVRPAHFYRRAHRVMFESMLHLSEQRVAIDTLTLKAEVERRGELDECGGAAYIASLTDGVPRSMNVAHYATIVREAAVRREAIKIGSRLVADAYDAVIPSAELVNDADKAIIGLQAGDVDARTSDMRESFNDIYTRIEWMVAHPGELRGIETGFATINELTLGWRAGDMIVLGARPSIGKTAFTLNTAVAAAKTGKGVAIISLEMRREQLEFRILSSLSGVQLSRIMSGHLGSDDLKRLSDAMAAMAQLPIFISDRGGQTMTDIRATCRRLRAEHSLGLVVVDYIQLVAGSLERRGATRNEELTDISHRLKWLADEVSCPVIVLSQLSRAGESRSDKRPILSDLRESGALEQDADLVAFLHRKHHRESGPTQFILEKQRNGPTGTVQLSINRDTQRFTDEGLEPEQSSLPEEAPAAAVPDTVRRWRQGR